MPNSLDPHQGRHSVGPDLVPNCLQKLSAGYKMLVMSLSNLEYIDILHECSCFIEFIKRVGEKR